LRFARPAPGEPWAAQTPLRIEALASWQASLSASDWVSGPGLERFAKHLAVGTPIAADECWYPRATSLLSVGLERLARGEKDNVYAVEPLYLRPSSAEEKWRVDIAPSTSHLS